MEAKDAKPCAAAREEDAYKGQLFDELSRGLAGGTISRRRVLKLAGVAILGSTGLLSLFPRMAGAQSSVYGRTVTAQQFSGGCAEDEPAINNRACIGNMCGGNRNCFCAETVTGKNRCVNLRADEACPQRDQCDSNRDCPGDMICIKIGGCCGHPRRNDCARPCG